MRLNYLELRNYRKFEHVQLELSDGIIGIVGNNGVGKSTLVEAIGWALFGNQKEIVRIDKESIRRIDAPKNEPTIVKLEFWFGGDEYLVTREMTGKSLSMDAKLLVNGKLVATGSKEVTHYIEKKFGMDYKSFFISVFARQKELNALSSLTERDRRITVVRMLGIDKLDDIIEDISRKERLSRERVSDLGNLLTDENGQLKENSLANKRNELERKKELLSQEVSKLRKSQGQLREEENSLESQTAEISDKLRALREAENKYYLDMASLQSQKRESETLERNLDESLKARKKTANLDKLNEKLKELRNENEQLLNMKAEHEKLLRMQEARDSIKEEIAHHDNEISRLSGIKKKLSDLLEEFRKAKDKLDGIEKELSALRDNQAEQRHQIRNLERSIEENEAHLKQIEELGPASKCPTCERMLGEHYEKLRNKLHSSIEEEQEKMTELRESFKETEDNVRDRAKRLEALRKKQEALRKKEKLLIQDEKTVDIAIQTRDKLLEKQEKLQREIDAAGPIKFDSERLAEVVSELEQLTEKKERLIALVIMAEKSPEIEKQLEHLKSEMQKLENRIRENAIDELEIELLENNIKEIEKKKIALRKQEDELYETIVKFATQKEAVAVEIQAINRERSSLADMSRQLSELEEKLIHTTRLLQLTREFRKDLISRIIPTLSQIASDLIIRLTDGKYTSLNLDDGYNISLEDAGEMHRLERFSGGESDLANLCLRLAISRVIAERAGTEGVNLLVLDEIFGSQDATRKRNLLMAFNALAKQFRQIFLITHVEDVRDWLSNILEVYEDERGTSHIRFENNQTNSPRVF